MFKFVCLIECGNVHIFVSTNACGEPLCICDSSKSRSLDMKMSAEKKINSLILVVDMEGC